MKKLRVMGLILCACILLTGLKTEVAVAANEAKATTFRLEKVEGTARVINSGGKSMSLTDGMLLYSGDTIQTDEKSYAYVSLDGSKLIKLEELSQAVIKKSGKKLEIKLEEGALYFEVNSKLADDEAMTVGTSNISLSIRGTAGVVRKRTVEDSIHDTVWLLDGQVELKGIGAAAGRPSVTIWGGERVDYVENSGDWKRDLVNIMEIPGFADVAMRQNSTLMNNIYQLSGLDTEWIAANADTRLIQDQEQNRQEYGNIFIKRQQATPAPKPEVQQAAEPIADLGSIQVTTQTTKPEESISDGGNSGGENGSFEEETYQPETIPSQTPAPTNAPKEEPTAIPSETPMPTNVPESVPTITPGIVPTATPTITPEEEPTAIPSVTPTGKPESTPAVVPTSTPSVAPTESPEPLIHTVYFWSYPNFPDTSKVELYEKQGVYDGEDAVAPADLIPPAGYTFVGWTDYTKIERDTDVYPKYGSAEDTVQPTATPSSTWVMINFWYLPDYPDGDRAQFWEHSVKLEEGQTIYDVDYLPLDEPYVEGYRFTGWSTEDDENFYANFVEAETEVLPSPTPTEVPKFECEVTFVDYDGTTVLSKQYIMYGEAATPPEQPNREGYRFIGWIPSYDCITDDTYIYAQYEKLNGEAEPTAVPEETPTAEPTVNTYTVYFLDHDGSTLSVQEVEEGQLPMEVTVKHSEYTFAGWMPEVTAITQDTVFIATYTDNATSAAPDTETTE